MKFINVAIILTATAASSAYAAAATDPTTAAQSGLKDLHIELKVAPMTLSKDLNFSEIVKAINENSDCQDKLVTFRRALSAAKGIADRICDNDTEGLDEIKRVAPFDGSKYAEFINGGYAAVNEEKKEWQYKVDSSTDLATARYVTKKSIKSKVDSFKTAAKTSLEHIKNNCNGQSLPDCFGDTSYDSFIKAVKVWIYGSQMLLGESSPAIAGVPPNNFFKEGFRLGVNRINVPQDRFSVTAIDSSLNLKSLIKTSDFTAAGDSLVNNLFALQERMKNAPGSNDSIKNDIQLRIDLARAIFSTPHGVALTIEVVERHVRAFERIAEGIIRNLRIGKALDKDLVTKLMKAWIMAVQMFREDGIRQMSNYATIALPTVTEVPTEPEPAKTTAPVVEDKISRQNSADSVGSTDSTVSTKSNGSTDSTVSAKSTGSSASTQSNTSAKSNTSTSTIGRIFNSLFG